MTGQLRASERPQAAIALQQLRGRMRNIDAAGFAQLFDPRGEIHGRALCGVVAAQIVADAADHHRSEEHTSDLQSLMRSSYAVFSLKKHNLPDVLALQHNKQAYRPQHDYTLPANDSHD